MHLYAQRRKRKGSVAIILSIIHCCEMKLDCTFIAKDNDAEMLATRANTGKHFTFANHLQCSSASRVPAHGSPQRMHRAGFFGRPPPCLGFGLGVVISKTKPFYAIRINLHKREAVIFIASCWNVCHHYTIRITRM